MWEDSCIIFMTVIIGSFIFVVGLAWNDFLVEFFDKIFGRGDLKGRFFYALFVTVLLIAIICFIKNLAPKNIADGFAVSTSSFASGISIGRNLRSK